MFQTFASTAAPEQGPPRLAALRAELVARGLDGYIVPRADQFQGEYVAPADELLSWLTGFTGSAGSCVVLGDQAGVFIDGRYRTQVRSQVDLDAFTPVHWPETKPGDWIAQRSKGKIGYDPRLHTEDELTALRKAGVDLVAAHGVFATIWQDRPAPPTSAPFIHPETLAGESSAAKRARIAAAMGARAAVITLSDSISWLLNIRGSDVPRNPVVQGYAILFADGRLDLFTARGEVPADVAAHLGPDVTVAGIDLFWPALQRLDGPVLVDPATASAAIGMALRDAGTEVVSAPDPCRLPKARKNPAEISATREAHLRDGTAMVEFLCWLDSQSGLTEIDVVVALEGFRRATNALHDLSFDTICGAGPNGAIIHYRVTEATNRAVEQGDLLLVDSGGQYVDGTTDITRTVAIGDAGDEARECYTRVLQGMIAMSRARWPKGLAGRDLDALARAPLWLAGMDYDHGTGHGVGAFLSVHEGPQRLSRLSEVPLESGMILSNEPGYYREGAFGIRLENLLVVTEAARLSDAREQLCFDTLTFVPLDLRLVVPAMLSPGEREWLNAYHAKVFELIAPRLSDKARDWLGAATRAI